MDDFDDRWHDHPSMVLLTGFGNIFDVGHGWSYDGICAIAAAINGGDWALVERMALEKPPALQPS